ncbi:MAG: hypothetical protein Q9217_006193 [Psora testacea]
MDTNGGDVPKDYQNLNEVTAPPLGKTRRGRLWLGYSADNLRSKGRKKSLEESQGQTASNAAPAPSVNRESENYSKLDKYGNLNEVDAPSPVDGDVNRREPHLEDRSDESPPAKRVVDGDNGPSRAPRASRFATGLSTISYLIFFSLFGTLARLGLQALTFYPGAPVQTGLLWANVSGSFLMGFLAEDQNLFREEWGVQARQRRNDEEKGKPSLSADKQQKTFKKTLPLYIGLATGFCGSFTSFSSFMRDAFYALANALPVPISHPSITTPPSPISTTLNVPRNPGYSFMAVLSVLIITLGLSLSALSAGAHLALALEPYTPPIPLLFAHKFVNCSFILLAWGCWLAAIIMTIFPPDRPGGPVGNASWSQETWRSQALFALAFAPPGCLLRFYAALHLNGRISSFPLGTFAVNIFGSAMEAMFIDLQHAPMGGMVGCQVLQGMSDGFCGCLTTVSTWVAELNGLRRRHAYTYGGTTIALGLSSFIVITGSLMWTQGFQTALCTS